MQEIGVGQLTSGTRLEFVFHVDLRRYLLPRRLHVESPRRTVVTSSHLAFSFVNERNVPEAVGFFLAGSSCPHRHRRSILQALGFSVAGGAMLQARICLVTVNAPTSMPYEDYSVYHAQQQNLAVPTSILSTPTTTALATVSPSWILMQRHFLSLHDSTVPLRRSTRCSPRWLKSGRWASSETILVFLCRTLSEVQYQTDRLDVPPLMKGVGE